MYMCIKFQQKVHISLLTLHTADVDFMTYSQSFSFSTGDPTPCIDIDIEQDLELENCETFDIEIVADGPNVFPSPDTATVTIYDDDGMHPYYQDA